MTYVELWYCDPGHSGRRCHTIPCHGHRATRDQLLIAKTVARMEGVDWWALGQPEVRARLRRAWRILTDIRAGSAPDGGPPDGTL